MAVASTAEPAPPPADGTASLSDSVPGPHTGGVATISLAVAQIGGLAGFEGGGLQGTHAESGDLGIVAFEELALDDEFAILLDLRFGRSGAAGEVLRGGGKGRPPAGEG